MDKEIRFLFLGGSAENKLKSIHTYYTDQQFEDLVKRSYVQYPSTLHKDEYVFYDDFAFKIRGYINGRYIINEDDIKDYLECIKNEDVTITDSYISELNDKIHQEIENQTLPYKRYYYTITDVFNVSSLLGQFFEIYELWGSLMIIDNYIVGFYSGYINNDEYGCAYNYVSSIQIRRNFQGKHLCYPFAKSTYKNVVETYHVSYFNINIESETPISACHCYVRAATDNGYEVYINGHPYQPNDCMNYYNKSNRMVIYVPERYRNINLLS